MTSVVKLVSSLRPIEVLMVGISLKRYFDADINQLFQLFYAVLCAMWLIEKHAKQNKRNGYKRKENISKITGANIAAISYCDVLSRVYLGKLATPFLSGQALN